VSSSTWSSQEGTRSSLRWVVGDQALADASIRRDVHEVFSVKNGERQSSRPRLLFQHIEHLL